MGLPVTSTPEREIGSPPDALSRSVLVLGGGVAGLQAAIDLAQLGFQVHLVERSPSIGGRMAQLDKTFPTNDCSLCILAPKMIECAGHDNVTLHTHAELEGLDGALGHFRARIRHHARHVDPARCTGCGACAAVCPVCVPSEFEMGLQERRAAYKPFPQAVPNVFTITRTGQAPCSAACPAGLNAAALVQLTGRGKPDRALSLLLEHTPLVGSLGRLCEAPCQGACSRGQLEGAVAIRALERAAADHGKRRVLAPLVEESTLEARALQRVAVVGAGPCGITAAHRLARMGYPVTLLEAAPRPGGRLWQRTPAFRLPREVLEKDVRLLEQAGVVVQTGTHVSDPGRLRGEGFAAVLVATGGVSAPPGLPGGELAGVLTAGDLFESVALERQIASGDRALVLGASTEALYAARSLVRLGVGEVTLAHEGPPQELAKDHVRAAREEGVALRAFTMAREILGEELRASRVRLQRTRLDPEGHLQPVPGSEHELACEIVVVATPRTPGRRPRCEGDGVFAAGELLTGTSSLVEAVGAGARVAAAISRYLQGLPEERPRAVTVAGPSPEALARARPRDPAMLRELPPEERRRDQQEVVQGLDPAEARTEGERCLGCGGCCECHECERVCRAGAVDHGQEDRVLSVEVGACVIATGFDPMDPRALPEYGGGTIRNVITGLELERLLSASGPTGGHVQRPSDGEPPRRVAFIQCVGSRDLRHHAYCSAVCCMHATKEAILAHEHDSRVESTVFYMDLRAAGKTFQDYVARAQAEYRVRYVRARPGRLVEVPETGDVKVLYEDTTTGERREEPFDLVVLCPALVPSSGVQEVATLLEVELDEHGFLRIPEPLTAPVDTTRPGVLAVGYAAGPQDIPDSVVGAAAAAGRAAELLGRASRAQG